MFTADTHIGRNAIRRARVVESQDDGELQLVTFKGFAGEYFKLAVRAQDHGLSSHVPVGSVGTIFMGGGRPDQAFVIGFEHPDHRPKDLKEGESVMYDNKGQTMSMVEGPLSHMKSPGKIVLEAPEIVLKGNVHLGDEGGALVHRKGDVDSDGDAAVGSASKVYAV